MLELLQGLLEIRDVDQVGLLVAMIGIEVVVALLLRRKVFQLSDSLCSLGAMALYAVGILGAYSLVVILYTHVHTYALFDVDWRGSVALIIGGYVIVDFLFYWYHRAIHMVRVGWAAHVVHHSSQFFNVGTALRSSFVEAFYEPLAIVPFVWLGGDPVLAVALLSLNHLYQYWIHTQFIGKLGPLEWVFNTPSHHRVHHASNVQYCDMNFGGTLIIWDRLFGTFAEEEEAPVYGIRHPLKTRNPLVATFHEWWAIAKDLRKAENVNEMLGYLFAAPGWQPNGEGETTRELQARLKVREA